MTKLDPVKYAVGDIVRLTRVSLGYPRSQSAVGDIGIVTDYLHNAVYWVLLLRSRTCTTVHHARMEKVDG